MNKIIILLIALLPACAMAQTSKAFIDSLARNVMTDLQDSWTLGIDSNNDVVDVRMYNKFKNLFDTAATITDDINAYYMLNTGGKKGMYLSDPTPKNFEIYAHDIALQVKSINTETDSITANTADAGAMVFTIRRKDTIQKIRQFVIGDAASFVDKITTGRHIEFDRPKDDSTMRKNFVQKLNDTKDALYKFTSVRILRVIIKYNDADSTCRIMAIENVTKDSVMVCLNDNDGDGVLNQEDLLPGTPGDFTADGRPDNDFDGVPDINNNGSGIDKCRDVYGTLENRGCPATYFSTNKEVSGFFGAQQNSAKINLPELTDLGYRNADGSDAIDVLQSQKGVLQNPGSTLGIYAGGSFAYYFGKRKRAGISVGFTYSGFSAQYLLTEPMIYTFKASDGVDDYRRQITVNSLTEDIAYSMFNFPVLFNYRFHIDKSNKTVLAFKAGPSFILFNNTSDYNTSIDFGGLYQIDTITKDAIRYYDYYDPNSTWNIAVTSTGINNQNTDPGAAEVFLKLYNASNGYDFASNKNYRGKEKLKRSAIAFNAGIDVVRDISNGLAIKFGGHFLYASLFERSQKYIAANSTADGFNSIYNSNAKTSYSAFGIAAGFVFNF